MSDIQWCRDIDWGNAPQWFTLAAAIVAGLISLLSLRTSRTSQRISQAVFEEDVRRREFAQARLVFGEIAVSRRFKRGVSSSVAVTTNSPELIQFNEDGEVPVSKGVGTGETLFLTANRDAQVWVLRVHNNSDELISQVSVSLQNHEGVIGGPIGDNLLGPHRTVEWIVAIPSDRLFAPKFTTVTFTDAMGQVWIRRGGQPVEKFPREPGPFPSKFKDPAKSTARARKRQRKSRRSKGDGDGHG